jgi:hypothetical protein
MIARVWHGVTRATDYDAYWTFLKGRAIPDYRQTPGNQGVRLLGRSVCRGGRGSGEVLPRGSALSAGV